MLALLVVLSVLLAISMMADNLYLVQLPSDAAGPRPLGAGGMIVSAADSQTAIDVCKGRFTGDADSAWDDADVTQLQPTSDLEGLKTTIAIQKTTGHTTEFSYTANDTDTWNDIIAALAVLMAADPALTNTISTGTGVLRVAAADNMGDKVMSARVEYGFGEITELAPAIEGVTSAGTKRDFTFDTSGTRPAVIATVKVVS